MWLACSPPHWYPPLNFTIYSFPSYTTHSPPPPHTFCSNVNQLPFLYIFIYFLPLTSTTLHLPFLFPIFLSLTIFNITYSYNHISYFYTLCTQFHAFLFFVSTNTSIHTDLRWYCNKCILSAIMCSYIYIYIWVKER